MKRLFTFGCSYTEFYWPTWADCLSPYFDETYNYGKCGAGNSYIFNHFASVVASKKLTEKDTVIIQWSSIVREDRILPHHISYQTGGLVYNNKAYDKEFYTKYFNAFQMAVELVSFLTSIIAMQSQIKFKLKMFYLLPPWFGPFLGEPVDYDSSHIEFAIDEINNHKIFDKLKEIYNQGWFITDSLEEYNLDTKTGLGFSYFNDKVDQDHHPLPDVHLKYTLSYLLPWLGSSNITLNSVDISKLQNNIDDWVKVVKDPTQVTNYHVRRELVKIKSPHEVFEVENFKCGYIPDLTPYKYT